MIPPSVGSALVTGATGFIGRTVCAELLRRGWRVRAAVREAGRSVAGCETVVVGDIGAEPPWAQALESADTVIHLAARVHEPSAAGDADVFERVNCAATQRLAHAAAGAGTKRFVFLSSVKVNGESTPAGARFGPSDAPRPHGNYARSKRRAEEALNAIASTTALEVVVVRPPLVYGPGVGANFLRLLRLVDRGVPLPFGSVSNRRSLIYVGNLADVVALSAVHPAAAGQTLLVSDGEDLSTSQLVSRLAAALRVEARLFAFPPSLLRRALALAGRSLDAARLFDSLAVDSTQAMRVLGWQPRFTVGEGMASMARWYRSAA
jgi:nucleoside-diphosphate-sugar epimerase